MAPKRHKTSGGPPAKAARGLETAGKARQELENLLVERNQLKSKLSTAVTEIEMLKASTKKLDESYNSCVQGLLIGMEAMTKLLTSGKHHLPQRQVHTVSNKLQDVVNKVKDLSVTLAETQIPCQTGTSAEREEIESLLLTQNMLFEEFEEKLFEKEQTCRDLQYDMEQQEETHLKEIDELKNQIEELNASRVDPSYRTCSICLEPWSSSGSHRVTALICGHVFGDMCIREHLIGASECPMCRTPADIADLRYLFLETPFTE
ncbi:hypothetical protein AWZ03_006104 [Drosophila navojoa]|uniref:RING-type domain-containing protein n=1 Tax=Drosophila navojoa TaxID=7232 RepID=A0A484BGY0_DRONA|nr:E3 ubiquitin-protein ligase RFWD3-like [Drosophila navojoa]TDG47512.1 hypothetical protein AWZ03_006104 [Drosophila navojoa]